MLRKVKLILMFFLLFLVWFTLNVLPDLFVYNKNINSIDYTLGDFLNVYESNYLEIGSSDIMYKKKVSNNTIICDLGEETELRISANTITYSSYPSEKDELNNPKYKAFKKTIIDIFSDSGLANNVTEIIEKSEVESIKNGGHSTNLNSKVKICLSVFDDGVLFDLRIS